MTSRYSNHSSSGINLGILPTIYDLNRSPSYIQSPIIQNLNSLADSIRKLENQYSNTFNQLHSRIQNSELISGIQNLIQTSKNIKIPIVGLKDYVSQEVKPISNFYYAKPIIIKNSPIVQLRDFLDNVESFWQNFVQRLTPFIDYLSNIDLEDIVSENPEITQNIPNSLIWQTSQFDMQLYTNNPDKIRHLTWRAFEAFIAQLIAGLGFKNIVLTPRSGDGGKDIIAEKIIHAMKLTFYFECKHYSPNNPIGPDQIRQLLGVLYHNAPKVNAGVLVTTSGFTKGGLDLLSKNELIKGKDMTGILKWIDEYNQVTS